jgi:hypothetical protein
LYSLAKVGGIEGRVAKVDGIEGGASLQKTEVQNIVGPSLGAMYLLCTETKIRYSGEILHFASNIPFQLADNLSKEQLRKSLYFLEHGFYINI